MTITSIKTEDAKTIESMIGRSGQARHRDGFSPGAELWQHIGAVGGGIMSLAKTIVFRSGGVAGRCATGLVRASALILGVIDFRGVYRVARWAGSVAPGAYCVIEPTPGARFRVDLSDPYWLQYLPENRPYEPELFHVMRRFGDETATFFDLGANVGYWSVIAHSRRFPRWRTVAIEASPATFRRLQVNASMNEPGLICLNRAVASASGRVARMVTEKGQHAGARVATQTTDPSMDLHWEAVQTISLDDLVQEYGLSPSALLIVKLDVEGSELDALRAARCLETHHRMLFMFEDDDERSVTAHLLGRGYEVFYPRPDGVIECVSTAKAARAIECVGNDSVTLVAARHERLRERLRGNEQPPRIRRRRQRRSFGPPRAAC